MKKRLKRMAVAIVGGLVVLIGLVLIPYPGAGWLVVFLGLGILSTQFAWAKRCLTFLKSKYSAWNAWVKLQHIAFRAVIWLATAAVVVGSMWLVGGFGFTNELLGLGWDWMDSPIPFFN